MRAWLQRFMYGRYGQDDLGRVLPILALVFYFAGIFTKWTILTTLGMVVMILCIFRMFSRNAVKRGRENVVFLRAKGKIMRSFNGSKTQFRQRKTHRIYRCPSCKQKLRVPRGKGHISISCRKCGVSFEKTT